MTKQRAIKVDPEIVRARNRARSHFRREAKAYEERSMSEARDALRRASNYSASKEYKADQTKTSAIVRWVTGQAQAVFASLDIKPRMDVQTDSRPDRPVAMGSTDFKTIHVRINTHTYNEDKPADVARLIALTKGIVYHEGGHILYTIPVLDLLERAKEQGYVPRLNNGMDESVPDIYDYRWTWNLLEDQRMECAVVRMSPIIERYLQVVVLDLIIKTAESAPYRAWPFVTGRSYLPKSILSEYRRVAVEYAIDNDQVDTLREIDRLVRAYKRATTEREMAEIVYQAVPVFKQWLGGRTGEGQVDDHTTNRVGAPDPQSSATESDEWAEPSMPSRSRPKPEPSHGETPEQSKGSDNTDTTTNTRDDDNAETESDAPYPDNTASDDDSDESDDDGSGSDESGDTTDTTDTHNPGTGAMENGGEDGERSEDQQGLVDTVKDALSEVIDSVVSQETVSELAGQVNDAINRGIAYDPTIQPMSPELVAQTYEVRAGMLDTLEPLAVQADPSWRFRQESGVLDPGAFVSREPGESDFWVGLDDSGAQGHDLAVSVVLDVSFSMGNHTDALSVGAMGIRLACEDLGIPCTLSTFASSGYLWQTAEDPTDLTMVHAHGGTEPMEALEDLPNQQFGKSRHLVVVFTDGEWTGVPSFAQFRTPGMYIIGVGFGWGVADSLDKRKPDALLALESVSQLPAEVTKALIGYLV